MVDDLPARAISLRSNTHYNLLVIEVPPIKRTIQLQWPFLKDMPAEPVNQYFLAFPWMYFSFYHMRAGSNYCFNSLNLGFCEGKLTSWQDAVYMPLLPNMMDNIGEVCLGSVHNRIFISRTKMVENILNLFWLTTFHGLLRGIRNGFTASSPSYVEKSKNLMETWRLQSRKATPDLRFLFEEVNPFTATDYFRNSKFSLTTYDKVNP